MNLSKSTLSQLKNKNITVSDASVFDLPEKVLQFGTGVLLRGLPDYFIDKANRQGIFNGRVVVIKSTAGSSSEFGRQDGLYTLHIKGIEGGKTIEEDIICSAVSRVLSAASDWQQILECARNPDMEIVISNTTEIGIQLIEDDISQQPPVSFPGKLLAFLYERYKTFNGEAAYGMVIVPTELIVGNGRKLKSIVLELAKQNNLSEEFISWLNQHNTFCDSLVDRIVPGKPDENMRAQLEEQSGYQDDLRIMSEVYRLWAIEGDAKVAEKLSFSKADKGVIIAPDIEIYRELKLRLLNGTHTLSCGAAFLAGFQTVKNAMDNAVMEEFISQTMKSDIAPAIPYDVSKEQAEEFSDTVLDRFRNPHINHLWHSITLNYSAKLNMRVVPVLENYYKKFNTVPKHIALGFAAYILFVKPVSAENGIYYGEFNGSPYKINDERAGSLYEKWQLHSGAALVDAVLSDTSLWDTDLTQLPGFSDAVAGYMQSIQSKGVLTTLSEI